MVLWLIDTLQFVHGLYVIHGKFSVYTWLLGDKRHAVLDNGFPLMFIHIIVQDVLVSNYTYITKLSVYIRRNIGGALIWRITESLFGIGGGACGHVLVYTWMKSFRGLNIGSPYQNHQSAKCAIQHSMSFVPPPPPPQLPH